jgi:predicted ATPase/class 3 adenylate cyclase
MDGRVRPTANNVGAMTAEESTTAAASETLVFLFTDLESSTRLWERHPETMKGAMARHDAILRGAIGAHGGTIVKQTGDGLLAVFSEADDALAAALQAQLGFEAESWEDTGPLRVRIGIHRGEGQFRAGDYYGSAVNRAARIMSAGHGGQVLVSGPVATLLAGSLPDGASLRDLGEHRLKDLAGPEQLFQLVVPGLRDSFPPVATLDVRPNNLPTQTSVFMGRESELRELRSLLDSEGVRLVTMTGPGGTGKTRLALQAAADQIDRFEDGVFFVDLADEREPEGAFSAVVRTVGIEAGDEPASEALRRGLRQRHMLLVLDNFEQVTDAAVGVADLLSSCPDVVAVITSREALRVRGERLFPVPPLSLPPPGNGGAPPLSEVVEAESVRLFVERAVAVRPDFEITEENVSEVAAICIRLDGLPLAIELAAARLKLFSPEDLLGRLERRLDLLRGGARDLPGRQQTLRGTIEWSYELLSEDERRLFQLFSVFSGARFEAVEEVADRVDSMAGVDVIDGLESLVDKSLVRSVDADGPWFEMLQTMREYAAEQLAADAALAAEVRRAHAEHYVELAVRLRPKLVGGSRADTLVELARELDNMRAAWRYWVEAEDVARLNELLETLWALHDAMGWYHGVIDLANDLLGVLALGEETPERVREEIALQTSVARSLMAIRGYTVEVEEAFLKALRMSEDAGESPQRFPVLRSLASLYALRAEFDRAADVGRELLTIAEGQDDPNLNADAHLVIGSSLAFTHSDTKGGMEHIDRSIELFDPSHVGGGTFQVGPSPGVIALTTSALLLYSLGFPNRSLERAQRALDLSAQLSHPYTSAYAHFHVGLIGLRAGNGPMVAQQAAELLQVANAHEYHLWRALAIVLQGLVTTMSGNSEEGVAQVERGIALYRMETTPPVFWSLLLSFQAKAYGAAGRVEDGLSLITGVLESTPETHGGTSGFRLLRAELLTRLPEPRVDEAIEVYTTTMEGSWEIGERMASLEAATGIAELRAGTPDGPAALERLSEIYATFTEGFDFPQLAQARALLEAGPPG